MSLRGIGELQAAARQVALLRLLLLAIGLAVLTLGFGAGVGAALRPLREYLAWLLLLVGAASAMLAIAVRWVRAPWQLALQLVFDLAWAGLLVFCTGDVGSPAVVMLFAIVLGGTLALPSTLPFVMSSLAALALTAGALLSVAGWSPLPDDPRMDSARVLGVLATQVAALFLVDVLGQLLVRRAVEQRAFTSELLDQLGEGVLAVDRSGALTYANDEAIRLLGLAEDGLTGRRADDVLQGDAQAPVRALLARDDLPVLERHPAPGGRSLVLRVTALADRRGRPIGRTLLVADETRLLRLEESARRAEHLAALGEMAAGIAHEVRNPLTSLRGCAQEIAEINRKDGHRDAADLAGIMVAEADRLARIVDDFLAFSRIRPPRRDVVELHALLTQVRELHGRRPLPDNLALECTVDEECPPVLGDPDQLRQVVDNLLANALDAVRRLERPRILLAAHPASSGTLPVPAVELRVVDNGPGIPPQLKEQVFTPFFSTKSQGTGLGLALVQRIVREHEGTVRLEDAAGGGTAVVIALPAHSQTRQFVRALGGR